MIRKESRLADLIVSAGLIGKAPVPQDSQLTGSESAEVERPSRPCSAPTSRRPSSTSSRQLSRANSRAAVILGLQATSNRRSTAPVSDLHNHDNTADSACRCNRTLGDSTQQVKDLSQHVAAWQETLPLQQPGLDALLQQLQAERQQQEDQQQQLHKEVDRVSQQLEASQTTVQTLRTQLQQQHDAHQQVLSDLQAQADSSSKKLFRELKAAEAAKEQALAGKRTAERANRDLQQELAAVQAQQQQQQQQLTLLEERLAAANKKFEQQTRAHEDARQRAAATAAKQQEQLKQKLKAQEATLKEAEESLRKELHKRTSTMLNMQVELEGKGAALQEAAVQQQVLQGRLQELEQQLSTTLSTTPSIAAGINDQAEHFQAEADCLQRQHRQQHAAAVKALHAPQGQQQDMILKQQRSPRCVKSPVLDRQLKLPAAVPATAEGPSLLTASTHTHDDEEPLLSPHTIDINIDNGSGGSTSRTIAAGGLSGGMNSRVNSRPVSASVQLLRQSLQALQGGGSSSEAVKVLAAQVEGLTAALAAAKREMAAVRQEYAQELQQLSGVTAAAEAAVAACWQSYDVTFKHVTQRVTQLLQDQCQGAALPFHRPRSAAAAAAVGGGGSRNVGGTKGSLMFGKKARPASARPATAAGSSSRVEQQQQQQQGGTSIAFGCVPDSEDSQQRPGSPNYGGSSSKQQMQGANAPSQRPQTAGSSSRGRYNSMDPCCSPSRPASAAAAGSSSSSSSVHGLSQMNQRLCAENALLLVELSKWEAGHHHKQVALAAATKQQARFSRIGVADHLAVRTAASSSGGGKGKGFADVTIEQTAAVAVDKDVYDDDDVMNDDDVRSDSCGDDVDGDDEINDDQQQQQSNSAAAAAAASPRAVVKVYPVAHKTNDATGTPVKQALELAVTEALQAGKGPTLPASLLQNLAATHTSSSSGWTAAGSSRLAAALSAAEINLKLRTRVVQLESTVAALQAEHAGADSQSYQQQQRVQQLEAMVDQLTAQLAEARLAADNAQEKMQQSLAVAAAAVAQPHPPQLQYKRQTEQQHISGQRQVDSAAAAAAAGNGSAAAAGSSEDVLSCGGGGMLRDLPVAVQQEVAAQRRIAAAAKHDKEVCSRTLTQLELRYSSLAAKLVKTRQAVANRDGQIAQLQQALAVAHNALLDAGMDQQQQQRLAAAGTAGDVTPGLDNLHQDLDSGRTVSIAGGPAAGSSDSGSDHVMSMVLSADVSDVSLCSSRLSSSSSVYSSAAAANAAAAASWSAAMEGRERQRQLQQLTAECADKQQRIQLLQHQVKKLQQQLSKQQRAADAAVAAVTAEENSRRKSLAGDLEGATVAMQDATRKLAAKEMQCMGLQQELTAALRRQQQLEFDVGYLRGRRAAAAAVGASEAAVTAVVAAAASEGFETAAMAAQQGCL